MNPIAIIFKIFLLICNGQESRDNQQIADIRAIAINDSAVSLLFSFESYEDVNRAISLFDSSLKIQPDYYPAQCNKLTAYLINDQRIQSLFRLKELEVERPENPDIKLMLGILLLTTDDSSSSRSKFLEAAALYAKILQSLTFEGDKLKTTLRNYAINLKMQGNDIDADKILSSLHYELKYDKNEILNESIEVLTKVKGDDLRKELSRAR